jgi:hypothetical protein
VVLTLCPCADIPETSRVNLRQCVRLESGVRFDLGAAVCAKITKYYCHCPLNSPISLDVKMYLPLSSTFLHFLRTQLPLSPSNPVALNGQSETYHKDYKNLAILSPYHDAPNVPGVSVNLPDDCTVDQVVMVSSLPHSVPVLRMMSVPTQVTPTRIPWSRVRE